MKHRIRHTLAMISTAALLTTAAAFSAAPPASATCDPSTEVCSGGPPCGISCLIPLGGGTAEFGVVGFPSRELQVGDSLTPEDLQSAGVNLQTVDSLASANAPSGDLGVVYSGTAAAQDAEDDAESDVETANPDVPFDVNGIDDDHVDATAPAQMQTFNPDPVTSAAAGHNPRYDTMGTWKDRDGWRVYLRRGYYTKISATKDSGFGLTKVYNKHGLSAHAVLNTTRYPHPGNKGKYHISGKKYHFRTPIYHIKCSGWWIFKSCKVVEKRDVLASVDFRSLKGGGSFGVVTTYVEGYRYAPAWARNTIN